MPRSSRWMRSPLLRPLRSPVLWRVAAVCAAALLALMLVFRRPLGDWLWPDTRVQQTLARAEAALANGELSAADGSGARELFLAAGALDNDRSEARDGLVRTGRAALVRARTVLDAGQEDQARQALTLARTLGVAQVHLLPIEEGLRTLRGRAAGVDALLLQAQQAQREGRLDGAPDSALPLYQRVLDYAPERTEALEGREDAVADLLQQGWRHLHDDDVAAAAPILEAARRYDSGHAGLPAARAEFSRLLERGYAQVDRDLQRGRLDAARTRLQLLRQAQPDDARTGEAGTRLGIAFAEQAARLATQSPGRATLALQQAQALAPQAPATREAAQALERAAVTPVRPRSALSPQLRARQLDELLQQLAQAVSTRNWLTPPGASAFDSLRAAQALDPRDARVRAAATQLAQATHGCFEDALRGNRLVAARECLDAWQAVDAAGAQQSEARRRLAQRWIAVGSERLRAEDVAFAQRALEQAYALDAGAPELPAFADQVRAAAPRR